MLGIRRFGTLISRRLSTSASACSLESYKAVNEPVYEYLPGSKERLELEAKLKEYDSMLHEIPIVIGDEELTSADVHYQVRPHDHQNKLARYYYADKAQLEKAIGVSQKAHKDWQRTSLSERAEIFLRAADFITGKYKMDIMAATMLGQGKTIIQGEIDCVAELADFYRFNVEFGLDLQKWQPISLDNIDNRLRYRSNEGFWAAVAPFNFTAISGHLAGAPAFMGNVVLWKPSDTAMLSSWVCFKLLREAGVPPGVINFTPADGPLFGQVVTGSPLLAGINFTGSAKTFQVIWQEVAKNIAEYKSFPRLVGECGGKNFHFVHKSADAESVVNCTIRAAFEYSGQKCSACSRMYVPQSLWPTIKERLLEEHKKIKMGSPMEADTFLSAVIDDKAFDRIKSYIDHAKSSPSLTILAGGGCDNSKGYYVEPTIIETSDPEEKIMQEEIFGPITTIYAYPDDDYKQVLETVNSTSPFALTGSVFAKDPNVIAEASEILSFATGNFYINDRCTGSVVSQQPFGGSRKSGTNDKAGSPHYLLKFISPQAIKTTKVDTKAWLYPYMK